jgi:MarR family transcriptional regulator, temperature-dependent positive regulator of motility
VRYDESVSDADDATRLHDLADLIVGVGRQLRLPTDPAFEACSPVEISVMRYINANPGTSAGSASEATLLPSSNFSRVLRGLEQRGLVRRAVDERDARIVRLYPTDKADKSLQALRDNWRQTLGGIIDDPEALDLVNATLRRIENELVARRRSGRDRRTNTG